MYRALIFFISAILLLGGWLASLPLRKLVAFVKTFGSASKEATNERYHCRSYQNVKQLVHAAILLLLAGNARAAVGDVTFAIETNGWNTLAWPTGFSSNSMFYPGFVTNGLVHNVPSATNGLELTVISPGHDDTGAPITRTRTVYGTDLMRLPHPNSGTNDVQTNGAGAVIMRVANSGYMGFIYDLDSNITATVRAPAFVDTNAAQQCVAASGVEVTNNSTQPYPVVIGNWAEAGWKHCTGSTMRLRWVGFHASGRDGLPLACVKFIVTGVTSGVKVTNVVTRMSVDWSTADYIHFGEYISDFALSPFTQGELLRCDVIAYPLIGDSSAVLDTTLNTYLGINTTLPMSITNLCDKTGAYMTVPWIAVVSLTPGANPRVTNTAPENVNAEHYFGTGRAAFVQLAGSNNLANSHNDVGGAIVYYRAGPTNWSDGTAGSIGNIPATHISLRAYPGDSVTFTNDNGTDDISDRIRMDGPGITIGSPGTAFTFNNVESLILNRVRIDATGANFIEASSSTTTSIVWLTSCDITNMAQGVKPSSGARLGFAVRGCNLDGFRHQIGAFFFAGNYHGATNGYGYNLALNFTGMLLAAGDYSIIYNNYLGGFSAQATDALNFTSVTSIHHGFVFAQNVCEWTTNAGSPAMGFFGSGNSVHITNQINICNLLVGKRVGHAYNDSGSATEFRYLWTDTDNLHPSPFGTKHDTFGTPDAARTGGWPFLWAVGQINNYIGEEDIGDSEDAFDQDFIGLGSFRTIVSGGHPINTLRFTDRKANTGTAGTAGGGNYRLLSDSPAFRFSRYPMLPFDIEGAPRGSIDPPGAYAAGNARKGSFF